MSKKKKHKKHTLQEIYDSEDIINDKIFQPFVKSKQCPPPPTKIDGLYYCNLPACKEENAVLFQVKPGVYKCGHCYNTYHMNV